MKLPKIVTVFKIKANYKSGISEVFECRSFEIFGKKITWSSFSNQYKPLDIAFISVDDIESIWQVGYRKTVVWK